MNIYNIGDIQFVWKEENWPLHQDEFVQQFSIEPSALDQKKETIICETTADTMKEFCSGKLLQKNGLYELYQHGQDLFIVYHWATCRFAFGFWLKDLEQGDSVRYYFNPKIKKEIPLDAVRFFSCAGMHSKLLQKDALVYHAAYVDWNGQGILFAGKSGAGKSTQAKLWETYAGAEIINGDRAAIRKKEGQWKTYGYPCCGSSSICINRTLPLCAVVLLEKGEENRIEELTIGEKVRALLTGSERYLWDIRELERVEKIAVELIADIPIIRMVCKKDETAVWTLQEKLKEYGKNDNI